MRFKLKLIQTFLLSQIITLGAIAEIQTQINDTTLSLSGQIRPRFELSDRDRSGITDSNDFTTMRTRLSFKATRGEEIEGLIQFQDIRTWGDTAQLANDGGAQDVHQAYINLKKLFETDINLKLGRQEINLDGQRLVGAVNWTQQARSFDGALLGLESESTKIKAFAVKLAEKSNGIDVDDSNFLGLWAHKTFTESFKASATLLYVEDDSDLIQKSLLTYGARAEYKNAGLKGRVEAYKQTGDVNANLEADAVMYGARLGYQFDNSIAPQFTLWYDYLSGDENPLDNKQEVFDTLFATNHKFYGYMDLFLNIPVHTKGQGLTDLAIKFQCKPTEKTTFKVNIHRFEFAEESALSTKDIGEEIDIIAVCKARESIKIIAGYSHLFSDDNFSTKDLDWFFLQADYQF